MQRVLRNIRIKKSIAIMMSVVIVCTSYMDAFRYTHAQAENTDEVSVWDGTSRESMAVEDNQFVISTAAQLAGFAESVNAGNTYEGNVVSLQIDIDINGNTWIPIGENLNNFFAGTFEGNGHTISNLVYEDEITSATIVLNAPCHSIGLFGVCKQAEINDLSVLNSKFTLKNESGYTHNYTSIDGTSIYAGGVCGYIINSELSGIAVKKSEITAYTGAEAGSAYVGGICGSAKDDCTFSYCESVDNNISGTSASLGADCYAGGLIGELQNEGLIYQSYNTSAVSGGHINAAAYTGGIVGKSVNSTTTLSSIRDSYNKGEISHTGSWLENGAVGGIIGSSSSSIVRCYNSGNITAVTNTVGGDVICSGIAGSGISSSVVSNCVVMSNAISGGTIKKIIAGNGEKNNNAAIENISGSPVDDANIRCTAEKLHEQSIYADMLWDFEKIWMLDDVTDYPLLRTKSAEVEDAIKIVNDAVDKLTITFSEGDSYNHVTDNIIIQNSYNKAQVVWNSDREDIISVMDGVVKRSELDCIVRLVATVSYGGYSVDKKFLLKVIGKNSNEEIQSEAWGMSLNDAREFISLIRDKRYTQVSANDQAVQVLIGRDTDEGHISEVMAEIMSFWEVPGESEFLKSKMGDVLGLIKQGQDAEMKELVGQFSDGLVKWDAAEQEGEVNSVAIAKKGCAIFESAYDVQMDLIEGFEKFTAPAESMENFSFKSDQDVINSSFTYAEKWGDVLDYVSSVNGSKMTRGIAGVISGIRNVLDLYLLWDAYEIEKQNAMRTYQQNYLKCRKGFQSASDENFKTLMAVNKYNLLGNNMEDIDSLCETLYVLNNKFCSGIDDEYKVIIQCPVDVEVFDKEGNLVGCVKDNVIDSRIYNSVKIELSGVGNDEKILYLSKDEQYTVQLTGNDTGKMDVTLSAANEAEEESYKFQNIPLTNGKEMWLALDYEKLQQEEYPSIVTTEQGVAKDETKELDFIEKRYPVTILSCTQDSRGQLVIDNSVAEIRNGYYVPETNLRSLVTASKGYTFEGFYTDKNCSEQYIDENTGDKELLLYAKFEREQSEEETIHKLEKVAALEATCTSAGNIEYWICTECNKVLEDPEGKKEILLSDTVVPVKEHVYTEAKNDENFHWKSCQCGTIKDKEIHQFEWVVDREATATEYGVKHEECIICHYQKAYFKIPIIENKKSETGDKSSTLYRDPIRTGEVVRNVESNGIYIILSAQLKTAKYLKPIKKVKKTSVPNNITVRSEKYKIVSIAPMAFKGNTKIKSVKIGKNIMTIGSKAFYKCPKLTKIIISSKVSKIGKQAFYGCKKLKSITIKTKKLTAKKVGSKALKGIYPKAVIKVPKKKAKSYKKLLRSRGAGRKVKIRNQNRG